MPLSGEGLDLLTGAPHTGNEVAERWHDDAGATRFRFGQAGSDVHPTSIGRPVVRLKHQADHRTTTT